jgi:predicted DNA binding protein
MRYVTLRVTPSDGEPFHPVTGRIVADPDLDPVAMHRMNDLGDGTVALLAEVAGPAGRYRAVLNDSPEVREFTVVDGDGDSAFGYSRTETTALVEHMLDHDRDLEFVREMPIEYTAEGAQRLTLVGTAEAFARADYDPPEGVDIDIERTGEYTPEGGRLVDALTPRQREVLEAAVAAGYYETPREATHEDVAERVDCSPATVGEHLQKIERSVFGALVG